MSHNLSRICIAYLALENMRDFQTDDALLDAMDVLWHRMLQTDRDFLNSMARGR